MKKNIPYFDEVENEDFYCPICSRLTPTDCIEKHHLVPKSKRGKKTESVCVSCGDMIHKLFTNKELEKEYNTIDKIIAHPEIQKWMSWIQKKPNDFTVCMRSKKSRRKNNGR